MNTQNKQTASGNAPRYWLNNGSLGTREQFEDEQAARFPAYARDLAAQREKAKLPTEGRAEVLGYDSISKPKSLAEIEFERRRRELSGETVSRSSGRITTELTAGGSKVVTIHAEKPMPNFDEADVVIVWNYDATGTPHTLYVPAPDGKTWYHLGRTYGTLDEARSHVREAIEAGMKLRAVKGDDRDSVPADIYLSRVADLKAERDALLVSAKAMLAYIEMTLAHTGAQNVDEILKALEDSVPKISTISTAHHVGCSKTTRSVNLNEARAAIAAATGGSQ